jgi:CheY-like chemotaxis protein
MLTSVLVVDDDADTRWAMRAALEDAGYAVFEAPDGKAALAQLVYSSHGMVVVLDLQMPGMDGGAVLRTLSRNMHLADRHVVILATAQDRRTLNWEVVRLLNWFDIRPLWKPFDIDELVEAVHTAERQLPLHPAYSLVRQTPTSRDHHS